MKVRITDELREHPAALPHCDCLRCRAADKINDMEALIHGVHAFLAINAPTFMQEHPNFDRLMKKMEEHSGR